MKGITFLSTNFWLPTLPTEVSYHFYKLPFGKLTTLPIEERDYFLDYQFSDCPHCPLKLVIFFIIVLFDKLTTQPTIVSGHFSFQIPFAKCPHCPLVFYGSFKVPFDKLTALPTADGGQISSKHHNLCWPHCSSTVSYLFIIVLFDKLTRQPTIVSGHFSFQVPFADCPHCPLMLVVFSQSTIWQVDCIADCLWWPNFFKVP